MPCRLLPVNGSVSRSSMNEQYGGRTQAVSLIAAAVMSCMLLLGTGFIQYLPIPVLTAIVISALMGATEFHIAHRLFRADRKEFYIFAGAFLGVLVLGTIYGVIIGVLLSFADVIHRASQPKRDFLGVIPGEPGLLSAGAHESGTAHPRRGTLPLQREPCFSRTSPSSSRRLRTPSHRRRAP